MTLVPAAIILVGRHDREAREFRVRLHRAHAPHGRGHVDRSAPARRRRGLRRRRRRSRPARARRSRSRSRRSSAWGRRPGLVPLHTWLPRAHPIAPAHVSALMSGVMIKLAVYGLVRVLVEWLGELPTWYGVVVLAVGGASAVIGVVYAIFQHELKRLLAFHSIENVGIIVLGLGACLLLHTRGADASAGVALAAALLHTLNHAVFKGLLFLGAGAFERAAGSLEIDRLGGLLQRMPWTGGAFLVGAMAIAGLPPLNGFASEWLTLQSLLAVPANGGVAEGLAGALALGALGGDRCPGRALLREGGRARAARTAAACPSRGSRPMRRFRCAVRLSSSLSRASCSGSSPGCSRDRSPASRPGRPTTRRARLSRFRGTTRCRRPEIALVLLVGTALLVAARGRRRAAPAPSWACGQRRRARARLDERRVHEAAAARARGRVASHPRHLAVGPRRRPPGGALPGTRPASLRHSPQPSDHAGGALGSGTRAARAEREPDRVRRVPRRARDRSPRCGADRGDRMSGASVAAAGGQLVGGLVLAPLIPGLDPALEGAAAGQARPVSAAAVPRARGGSGRARASTSRGRRSSTDSRRPS